MIDISNVTVYGFEEAIRGMRNPKNSWNKMDSKFRIDGSMSDSKCNTLLGPNDMDLCMRLARGGGVHAKYRRYITVYMDINAPLYFWKEFDTYRLGVAPNPGDIEMNSCSTMHKIDDHEFTLDDFSCEHLKECNVRLIKNIITSLNANRNIFIASGKKDKDAWWQMIQLLPSTYMQMRTVKINYEVLANMYQFRAGHKLDEWRALMLFCKNELPCSQIFTLEV